MKKSFMPDFRRETKKFLEDNNISINTIVKQMGVHPNTAYSWKQGKKSPSTRNFEQLKKLAEGVVTSFAQAPPMDSDMLKRVMGRLDQLTKQIADLQESDGVIKERLSRLEAVGTLKKTHSRKEKAS